MPCCRSIKHVFHYKNYSNTDV
nr:unnamed protein product [Callosobruchus chinensis]